MPVCQCLLHCWLVACLALLTLGSLCLQTAAEQQPELPVSGEYDHHAALQQLCGTLSGSMGLCRLGLARAELFMMAKPPNSKATNTPTPIVLSVFMRANLIRDPSSGKYQTRVIALIWADGVDHPESEDSKGNMLLMPPQLRAMGWTPAGLRVHDPRDPVQGVYPFQFTRDQPRDAGKQIPWAMIADLPFRAQNIMVSDSSKPEHLAEVRLPGLRMRCPLRETHLGRPAIYLMMRPMRRQFNHGEDGFYRDTLRYSDFPRLVVHQVFHHMRIGFAGAVLFVGPVLEAILARDARVERLVSEGSLVLVRWDSQPYYDAPGKLCPQYDQRLVNNVAVLSMQFCAPGVRWIFLDIDEFFHLPVPEATIQANFNTCFAPYHRTVIYRRAHVWVRGESCARAAAQRLTGGGGIALSNGTAIASGGNTGGLRALAQAGQSGGNTEAKLPGYAEDVPGLGCWTALNETALWTTNLRHCHPLCYYNEQSFNELNGNSRGQPVRGKPLNGNQLAQRIVMAIDIHSNANTIHVKPGSPDCGHVLHVKNMFYQRVYRVDRNSGNTQRLDQWLYNRTSRLCRGCPDYSLWPQWPVRNMAGEDPDARSSTGSSNKGKQRQ